MFLGWADERRWDLHSAMLSSFPDPRTSSPKACTSCAWSAAMDVLGAAIVMIAAGGGCQI